VLESLIRLLQASEPLTQTQIGQALAQLVDETVPVALKADFLAGLARRGETSAEITSFARELRAMSIRPDINARLREGEILDIVGTGGDRLSTFNISTAAALVAAAAGVVVAKHGNRASTSSIGSADVLEALGIPYDLAPDQAVRSLEKHGFAFFFAPRYHPAFKHIIPARRLCAERGQATIFNLLGPLLNPAGPSAMLVGVPRPELCQPLARTLQDLGVRRAMVVCGTVRDETGAWRCLDELSPLGPSTITEFYQQHALHTSTFDPGSMITRAASLTDLRGGDRQANAEIIRAVLGAVDRGPRRDAVLLNAGAALFVATAVHSIAEGWQRAEEVIDSGLAMRKLSEISGA
jgi:anthranilate phosphoribosyltransferase